MASANSRRGSKRVDDKDILECKKVSINMAASYLGISGRTLMQGLREGKFPFGVAIQHAVKWTYVIPPARLIAWATAADTSGKGDGDGA